MQNFFSFTFFGVDIWNPNVLTDFERRQQTNLFIYSLPFEMSATFFWLNLCDSFGSVYGSNYSCDICVTDWQEEGWVVCRVFKKRITTVRKMSEHGSPCWYDDQVSFMPDLDSPKQNSHSNLMYQQSYCKKELDLPAYHVPHEHFLQLPLLESPKLLQSAPNSLAPYGIDINHACTTLQSSPLSQEEQIHQPHEQNLFHVAYVNNYNDQAVDQVTDWRVLDKFVASQLSHDDVPKQNSYSTGANNIYHTSNTTNVLVRHLDKQEMVPESASMSSSNGQIELWK